MSLEVFALFTTYLCFFAIWLNCTSWLSEVGRDHVISCSQWKIVGSHTFHFWAKNSIANSKSSPALSLSLWLSNIWRLAAPPNWILEWTQCHGVEPSVHTEGCRVWDTNLKDCLFIQHILVYPDWSHSPLCIRSTVLPFVHLHYNPTYGMCLDDTTCQVRNSVLWFWHSGCQHLFAWHGALKSRDRDLMHSSS